MDTSSAQHGGEELNDFGSIADVYDDLVSWAPYRTWVSDLAKRLRRHRLREGARVLDAACGTGLSTISLAREGLRVVGVDHSEDMLQRARAKAAEGEPGVCFVRGELTSLELPWTFEAAVCMHSGLDYILKLKDLARAFRSLRRHLRDGGLLAFDKCLDEPEFYRCPRTERRQIPGGSAVFHYSWDRRRKYFDQHCIVVREGPDGQVRRTEVLHRMLAVGPDRLRRMLEEAGFEELEPVRAFRISDPGIGIFRAV